LPSLHSHFFSYSLIKNPIRQPHLDHPQYNTINDIRFHLKGSYSHFKIFDLISASTRFAETVKVITSARLRDPINRHRAGILIASTILV